MREYTVRGEPVVVRAVNTMFGDLVHLARGTGRVTLCGKKSLGTLGYNDDAPARATCKSCRKVWAGAAGAGSSLRARREAE